ncbi:probable inactive shikimate kinase like 2, chloroplastic [Phalaenopsis equestris]|uniref:probable inactive shikimate kinase like 2, chloroplastic n=1 Tax=Phalaenopsis equestris TaxID=78828 RepID=UPI0009E584D8|nr:probable inactive shikimate kinase like 2, chloroplastic [Phalaenopsis equestris]
MAAAVICSLSVSSPLHPNKTPSILVPENSLPNLQVSPKSRTLLPRPFLCSRNSPILHRCASVSGKNLSAAPPCTGNYEFSDGATEVELRFDISALGVESSDDIFVDLDDSSLLIRVKASGTLRTLMQTDCLFERVKPAETIWYIDEDQLVVNLKKREAELWWPDAMESWDSLRLGAPQLLKGTSIYVIGESTEINQEVAKVLAVGIGYAVFTCKFYLGIYMMTI